MTRVARIGVSELFRGDGAQFGNEMNFITRQGRHLDFRKGKVLVVFNISDGDSAADEYETWNEYWSDTLARSTGENTRTQFGGSFKKTASGRRARCS